MKESITNKSTTLSVLRWTARILSILSISIVLLFMIGEGIHLSSFNLQSLLMFLFFPIGLYLGMLVAWKREGLGGIITIASLAGFYLVHRLTSPYFPKGPAYLILALPGFLFLLCGVWMRSRTKSQSN